MKPYTKKYLNFFGYSIEDFVPCELCGKRSGPPHHIDCRGMGGSKLMDYIENLMGLCFECHLEYGDKKQYMEFLKNKHIEFMTKNKPCYDPDQCFGKDCATCILEAVPTDINQSEHDQGCDCKECWADRNCDCAGNTISDADPGL